LFNGKRHVFGSLAEEDDLGLLEVAACIYVDNQYVRVEALKDGDVTFINQHETEIVSRRVLFVYFAKGGREVETSEEEANRDCFPYEI